VKITRRSPFTGKENTKDLPITHEEIVRWQGGELIQNVWPQLSPGEREFLMTGIVDDEWDDIFKDKE
jgi:hypothetical protein